MLVSETIKMLNWPHRQVRVVMRGSGDPRDVHTIVAVEILDGGDNCLYGMGESLEDDEQLHPFDGGREVTI